MTKDGLDKIPRIVILTPVHNEEEALPIYQQTVNDILLSSPEYDFRILFIEDGSTDRSWNVIQDICTRDNRYCGLRLSRNFGSHIALSAGFSQVEGDAVAILACDLQDPPEVVLEFLKKWRQGTQIVWGKRRSRQDKGWRVLASNIFYAAIRRFAMPTQSKFTTGSFLLLDKKVVKCIQQFHEQNRITFALVAWTGFNQAVIEYDRKPRIHGKSGWSFAKMIKAMYDTFIGFSVLPVKVMTLAGVTISILTIPFGVYLVFAWLVGEPRPGWTSLMLIILVLFGIQFLMIGVLGEYLFRIYSEVVRRPLFFISERTGFAGSNSSDAT